jgi:hypothetical protein
MACSAATTSRGSSHAVPPGGDPPHQLRVRPRAVSDRLRPPRGHGVAGAGHLRAVLRQFAVPVQHLAALAGVDRRRAGPEPDAGLGRAVPLRLRRHHGHRRLHRGACGALRHPVGDGGDPGRWHGHPDRHHLRLRRAARQGAVPGAVDAGAAVRDGLGHLARAGHQRRHAGHAAGAEPEAAGPDRHVRVPACTTWRWPGACGSPCSC